MRRRPRKILVLRPSQSPPNNLLRHELAGYYIGYALCALVGGVVLAVGAFLLFLFVCDCVGVADPAGTSGALLALVAVELVIMSSYGLLVVKVIRALTRKVRQRLGSYRRLPVARP
jgi:hypothetical protein